MTSILPLALGASAYGFAFGVLAAQAGFPAWGVGLMSGAVFAGSSQIVAIERLAADGALLAALAAGMALNLRYLGILASLAPVLVGVSWRRKLLLAHVTSDENWALTMAERAGAPRVGADFLLGSGLAMIAFWAGSTAAGAALGARLPDLAGWGIGFAFTAAFIAMARGLWRGRQDWWPYLAAFAATATLVRAGVPAAYGVLGGAACGVAAAALMRRRVR